MSRNVKEPDISSLSATTQKFTISEVQKVLDHLAKLSGLTCFEGEFVARLRGYSQPQQIPPRELDVLARIWAKHGRAA